MPMKVIDLVDASAAAALEHASQLQDHLRVAGGTVALRECSAELHRLVGDIVAMRNAAELLKRKVAPG